MMESYRLWFAVELTPAMLALESDYGKNECTKVKQQQHKQQQHKQQPHKQRNSSVNDDRSAKTSPVPEAQASAAEAADAGAISMQRSAQQQEQGKHGPQQRPREEQQLRRRQQQQRDQEQQLLQEQQRSQRIARAWMPKWPNKRSCWRAPLPRTSKLHRRRLTCAVRDRETENLTDGAPWAAVPALELLRTLCSNREVAAVSKQMLKEARKPCDTFVYSCVDHNAEATSAVSRNATGDALSNVAAAGRGKCGCTFRSTAGASAAPSAPDNMCNLLSRFASAPCGNVAVKTPGDGSPVVGLPSTVPGDCTTCSCSWCRCCCWRRYKVVAEMDRKKAHQGQNITQGHGDAGGIAHSDISAMVDVASVVLPLTGGRSSRHVKQLLVISGAITKAASPIGDCFTKKNPRRCLEREKKSSKERSTELVACTQVQPEQRHPVNLWTKGVSI